MIDRQPDRESEPDETQLPEVEEHDMDLEMGDEEMIDIDPRETAL